VISPRWRRLLDERLDEAGRLLLRVPGVAGFVVGGSLGRDEPWPASDIDLLIVFETSDAPAADLETARAELVDWWAASARAQTLDMGGITFTVPDIRAAMEGGPAWVIDRFDRRSWFHGIDKGYGGRASDGSAPVVAEFAAWLTGIRFDPLIVAARIDRWTGAARGEYEAARAAADPAVATILMRESARSARMALLESWGERLGSMGREWTRFERMARVHGQEDLAARITTIAGADVDRVSARVGSVPTWLAERIDVCWAARMAVGEDVSEAENARDQLAAFMVHVSRHRPDLDGPWTGTPDPELVEHLSELGEILDRR
jgi:predicted nucleotidyltransferase